MTILVALKKREKIILWKVIRKFGEQGKKKWKGERK